MDGPGDIADRILAGLREHEEARQDLAPAAPEASAPVATPRPRRRPWLLGVALGGVVCGALALGLRDTPPPPPLPDSLARLTRDVANLRVLRSGNDPDAFHREHRATEKATRRAMRKFPVLPDGPVLLARILELVDDTDTAAEAWREALRRAPGHAPAHRGLGRLLVRARRRLVAQLPPAPNAARVARSQATDAAARRHLAIALRTAEEDAGADVDRALLLHSFEGEALGLEAARDVARRLSPNAATRDLWLLIAETGSPEERRSAAQEALSHAPHGPAQNVRAGEVFAEAGDLPRALTAFETALVWSPGHLTALLGKASALLATGRAEDAESAATEALERAPGHWSALLLRSRCREHLGRLEAARADCEELRCIAPGWDGPLLRLASLLGAEQRLAAAVDAYDRALQIEDRGDTRVVRGILRACLGRLAAARDDLERALASRSTRLSLRTQATACLGAVLLAQGDAAAALTTLEGLARHPAHAWRRALTSLAANAPTPAARFLLVGADEDRPGEHDVVSGLVHLASDDLRQGLAAITRGLDRGIAGHRRGPGGIRLEIGSRLALLHAHAALTRARARYGQRPSRDRRIGAVLDRVLALLDDVPPLPKPR